MREVRRGNLALIIEYELSYEEAMGRLCALGASEQEVAWVVYVHPTGAPSNAGRARVLARFANVPPAVAVVDSVGMGMG
jgi:hypothetical protein